MVTHTPYYWRRFFVLSCILTAAKAFGPRNTFVRQGKTLLGVVDGKASILRPSLLSQQQQQQQQVAPTRLFQTNDSCTDGTDHENGLGQTSSSTRSSLWSRLDTIGTSGLAKTSPGVLTAGPLAKLKQIKKVHNPITYIVVALLAGFRWSWCFRNPYYWFVVAFCVKWYRARYVFKIPVWDRQPNWNNIITSKEQEKDLKAYTCLKCGSTLFIAKTREFFFEGGTGLAGLGCFACGAKGKENFVMDRERIVEDVADEDDYFDYERPLDFVSRAERRKIMKEAGGDEDRANQLLVDRANEAAGVGGESSTTSSILDAEVVEEKKDDESPPSSDFDNMEVNGAKTEDGETPSSSTTAAPANNQDGLDDLDALDMDGF